MDKIVTYGINKIDKDQFEPISNEPFDIRNKPHGGLWGSVYTPNNGIFMSDWVRFVYYDLPIKRRSRYYVTYKLKSDAKLFTLDTLDDYLGMMDKYLYIPDAYIYNKYQIDFEKLSKDYDAIHVTEKAVTEMRMFLLNEIATTLSDFYHYDVDSYILFNLDCIDRKSVKSYTLPSDFDKNIEVY